MRPVRKPKIIIIIIIFIFCLRRVDEFSEYGDQEAAFQYCRDVQQVQKRLADITEMGLAVNKARNQVQL